MTMKRCTRCGLVKPATDFNRNSASADGRQSYCRACSREYRTLHSRGTCVNASNEPDREFLCSTCGYKLEIEAFGHDGELECADMPAFCPACGDVVSHERAQQSPVFRKQESCR